MKTYPSLQPCFRRGCHRVFKAQDMRDIYCSPACRTQGHGSDRKKEVDAAAKVRSRRLPVGVVSCARHNRKGCREC